jgi:hypothetical protein
MSGGQRSCCSRRGRSSQCTITGSPPLNRICSRPPWTEIQPRRMFWVCSCPLWMEIPHLLRDCNRCYNHNRINAYFVHLCPISYLRKGTLSMRSKLEMQLQHSGVSVVVATAQGVDEADCRVAGEGINPRKHVFLGFPSPPCQKGKWRMENVWTIED